MDSIRLKARAKINLGLDVLGKREDGYHEVRMVMQTIGIYDRLILTKIPEEEIRITSNLAFLPVNENNLIYKAIKLLKDEYHFPGGVSVDLNKFIPVAAGMAGGSTDAASTMFGVNRLFGLNLSMGKMMELGVRLGADVPYCVMRGTALAEGIGEKLTRITPVPQHRRFMYPTGCFMNCLIWAAYKSTLILTELSGQLKHRTLCGLRSLWAMSLKM